MIGLHDTYLKKIYSQLFSTNALQPVNLIASEVLQPTKEIEPEVQIFTATFTTAADKDFYVTDVSQVAVSDGVGGPGTSNVSLVVADGTTKTLICQGDTTGTQTRYTHFSKQGLKLKRSANQQIGNSNGGDDSCIIGYYGSDRA